MGVEHLLVPSYLQQKIGQLPNLFIGTPRICNMYRSVILLLIFCVHF